MDNKRIYVSDPVMIPDGLTVYRVPVRQPINVLWGSEPPMYRPMSLCVEEVILDHRSMDPFTPARLGYCESQQVWLASRIA